MAITIPEIPEDAPFSAEQRQWLKTYLKELAKSISSGAQAIPAGAAGKPRALFLYGSQSGNAQALSEGFAERFAENGWSADAVDMEDHATVNLGMEPLVLTITSTWGEGDPPDNAIEFWEKFSAEGQGRLENTRFSVLSLGDTNYADFCEMGKRFDTRFEALGAKRIATRVDCDVDYEDLAEEWFSAVSKKLEEIGKEVFTTTVTTSGGGTVESLENIPFGKKRPFPAPMTARKKLNLSPSDRDTRHVELKLDGSDLEYEVGDAIATFPKNDAALVDEILSILPFNTSVSVTVPDGSKKPLRDALREDYSIRSIPKSLLKKWKALTSHPYLNAVIEDDKSVTELLEGKEVVDLLYEFPADFKSGQDFVNLLRRLQPRLYSIASSPKKHPGEVHLTVAKVTYESHGRVRKGVCSTFLCEGLEEDEEIRVFMQPTKHFRLPEDPSKDVIMVGPGTGIAPFRAFLEEREVTEAPGRNWLFFGNPHEETDYFYKDEFDEMQKNGVLSRIDVAWSRDQGYKIYVQDKIREFSEEVWNWIDGGAHFYVCGDANYMAPDVEKALFELIRKYGNLNDEGAADYIKRLKDEHRYQRDVY
ncbi:sulfite reductase subunit alpha [Verrucomicrobiales bacterium]|mgnify:CR=1 FL=1|nr:sulfite reductase subunit alpha [Verrucomicrobiales bacterium]